MSFYNGKKVVITGGSEGIGLSISKKLVQNGSHIILISRNQQKLDRAVEELNQIKKNPTQKISSISVDVTNFEHVEKAFMKIDDHIGEIDILINNAGVALPGYINDLSLDDYRQMMDLNYFGAVHTCKCIVPQMIQRKKGWIVNTSSMAGFLGLFGYTGYCASKFALIGFSEALKRELEPYNISVSVLCPPNTKTPGLEKENTLKPIEVLKTEEKAKTVSPEVIADSLIKNIPKRKFMILPTFDGSLAYHLNRISPKIIHQFVKRPEVQ